MKGSECGAAAWSLFCYWAMKTFFAYRTYSRSHEGVMEIFFRSLISFSAS